MGSVSRRSESSGSAKPGDLPDFYKHHRFDTDAIFDAMAQLMVARLPAAATWRRRTAPSG